MAGLRLHPAIEDGSEEGNRKLQRIGNEGKPTFFGKTTIGYLKRPVAEMCQNMPRYLPSGLDFSTGNACPPLSDPIRHCKNHNPAILEYASKVSRDACPSPGPKRNNSLEYLPLAQRLLPREESSGHPHRQNKSKPRAGGICSTPQRGTNLALMPPRLFYAAFFRMSARSVLASLIGIRLNFSTSTFKTSGVINAGKVGPRRILRMPR